MKRIEPLLVQKAILSFALLEIIPNLTADGISWHDRVLLRQKDGIILDRDGSGIGVYLLCFEAICPGRDMFCELVGVRPGDCETMVAVE